MHLSYAIICIFFLILDAYQIEISKTEHHQMHSFNSIHIWHYNHNERKKSCTIEKNKKQNEKNQIPSDNSEYDDDDNSL